MSDYKDLKILVVEDDDMNYIYLKQIFRIIGCNHERVKNGQSAIDICQSTGFDLILMDLQLPDINGYDTTKAIREIDKSVKIVAQTASKNPEDHDRATSSGCDSIMVKPYTIDDVKDLLKMIFDSKA